MSNLGGGDKLARGAHKAQFAPTGNETTEKWSEAFGEDHVVLNTASEEDRLRFEQETKQAQEAYEKELEAKKTAPAVVPFRAVQDRIVVARLDEPDKVGTLYLPDEGKEKPAEGIVVAVGPGKTVDGEFQPVTIRVGERVLFGKFSGQYVKIGLQEFLVLREEDIFIVKNQ
jgi:chaperonin GroES